MKTRIKILGSIFVLVAFAALFLGAGFGNFKSILEPPGSTPGDVLYFDGTNYIRLPFSQGAASTILTKGTNRVYWAAGSGGGGGLASTDIDTIAELNAIVGDADLAPVASPTFTGTATVQDLAIGESLTITPVDITGTGIDWSIGTSRYKVLAADTTFTFSNHAVEGRRVAVDLYNNSSAFTVTWPGTVRWIPQGAPAMPTNGMATYYFRYRGGEVIGSQDPEIIGPLSIGGGGTEATTAYGAKVNLSTAQQDIASATTTDIGSLTSDNVRITGTTPITSLGTSAPAGLLYRILFNGALTLTHNATTLILPGGANIPTAAGDTAFVIRDASGNWRALDYIKASGLPIASPLTTKGDLLGFSTLPARLPVGTDTQVLTADSTQPLGVKWGGCGGVDQARQQRVAI